MDEDGEGDAIMDDGDVVVEDMAYFTFKMHSDATYCIAVHPTIPNLVLTGGVDDKAYLWEVPRQLSSESAEATDVRYTEFVGHTDTVTSVGFNFNGNQFLTGSYDGTVRIYNVDSKELVVTLEGPEDIEWAKWHSRGNAVIAGSKDGTIWLWLSHNGQCMQVFTGHGGLVNCGGFTQDGKMIITGADDCSLRVWMPKTGVCKKVFDTARGAITCVSFGEDTFLAGSEDGHAYLFSQSSLKQVCVLQHAADLNAEDSLAVECVGFSNSSLRWMATGGMNQEMKVWEQTGVCRCVCPHEGGVVALEWHPTLPYIITASLDRIVRVWDGRNGALLSQLSGHQDSVTNVTLAHLSLDAVIGEENYTTPNAILTVSDDGTSKVFRVNFEMLQN
jgi:ribosome assembly protein SQT1